MGPEHFKALSFMMLKRKSVENERGRGWWPPAVVLSFVSSEVLGVKPHSTGGLGRTCLLCT